MEKNTVEWWISRLKDRELAEKWLHNCREQKREDSLKVVFGSLYSAIKGGHDHTINWAKTLEGFGFWEGISDDMKKNPEEFLLPEEPISNTFKVGDRVIVCNTGTNPVKGTITKKDGIKIWGVKLDNDKSKYPYFYSKYPYFYHEDDLTKIPNQPDRFTVEDPKEEFKIGDEVVPREGSKKGIIGKISQLQRSEADELITVTFNDNYISTYYNYQLILKKQPQSSHNQNQIYEAEPNKPEIVKTSRPIATVERAERPEGYSIQGKQGKAAITVQHLSYEGVSGS